jgi:YVTN family beta-propeller protein
MKKSNFISKLTVFFLAIALISCGNDDDNKPGKNYEEVVVVANRGGSSLTFIDSKTNQVLNTISYPNSEPMYAVYVAANDRLYVGDRAGKRVLVINPDSKMVETNITVGNGVFHMWADGSGKQLWVNNELDNSISVIDLKKNEVTKTINVGKRPHDVFVTQDGTKAFVSVINSGTTPDQIFSYSTTSFEKTGEVNVGKDPHLYHLPASNRLIVPCQSGQVYSLNGANLSVISNNPFVGAHGIFSSPDQRTAFVTNISGAQLYAINTENNTQLGASLASLAATPHNITVNEAGTKMFVTHSGATANAVSIYNINNGAMTAGSTVTASTNPFGIVYYKRALK